MSLLELKMLTKTLICCIVRRKSTDPICCSTKLVMTAVTWELAKNVGVVTEKSAVRLIRATLGFSVVVEGSSEVVAAVLVVRAAVVARVCTEVVVAVKLKKHPK